jgi:hypothetical protein
MPTIGEMIAQHQEIKRHVERETEAFSTAIKPFSDALTVIEQQILVELDKQGLKNSKSEHGTAYKSETMSVKVDDREKYLQFVQAGNWKFLDARVLKEPVAEWIEAKKTPPPGVSVGYNIKCNIRKS